METQRITCLFNGPISSSSWINVPSARAFCFGCADGTILVYRQLTEGVSNRLTFTSTAADFFLQLGYDFAFMTSAHEGEVNCLTFDPNHCRIASTGKGTLRIWDLDETGLSLSLAAIIRSKASQEP
jgi:WD40 repeat protein